MAAKYHQIALSDIFQTAKTNSLTIAPHSLLFFQSTLIWMNLFPLNSIRLFIAHLAGLVCIHCTDFLLPLSCRKSFPYLLIPCFCCFYIYAGNCGISVASRKSLMLPSCQALNMISNITLNSCFKEWSIIPNPSASSLMLLLHRCLPLIPLELNSMLPRIILKP